MSARRLNLASLEISFQLPLELGLFRWGQAVDTMRVGFCMFHQINGMIGFARNWEDQSECIGEYVREVVQQIENVVVEVCLRVIDRRCVGPSWLVTVGGSRRGYAIGYAGVGALAAETLDAIVILW